MDNPELTKEWFVTREGRQFEPRTKIDLRNAAERGEPNPQLDKVRGEGMDGWMPYGKTASLSKKKGGAEVTGEKTKTGPGTVYQLEENKKKHMFMKGKWDGNSSISYFYFTFVFTLPWILAVCFVAGVPGCRLSESPVTIIVSGLMILSAVSLIYVHSQPAPAAPETTDPAPASQ